MDLISGTIWKVGARAKEMLSHKEEQKEKEESSEAVDLSSSQSPETVEKVPAVSAEIEPAVSEEVASPIKDATVEAESSPRNDNTPSAEKNLLSGIAAGDIKDVSNKAVESAKSFGSYIYGLANKTTHSLSETAKNLKQVVEQNTILSDFNKEQEAFVNSKSKSVDGGVPPWVGCDDEENVKQQILSLSADRRNFLRSPPTGVQFDFNFDTTFPVAMIMLKEDPELEKMRFDLVPKLVNEESFWRNYFYRVSLIKQSTRLSSLAHQKSSSGESSTWSGKKSSSDESMKAVKSESIDYDKGSESPTHEFVSDTYQISQISKEDIKQDMKLLGVSAKGSEVDEWEKELQQELQEYEVVSEGHADDPALESEIERMLVSENVKDVI